MKTIHMSQEQHEAITVAITMGALNERQATLRMLIANNQDHPSISNSFERELEALRQAARIIITA